MSTRAALRTDVGQAARVSAAGTIAFAAVEYVLTLWRYAGDVSVSRKIGAVLYGDGATPLRFMALTATLALVLWLLATVALTALALGWRALDARGMARPARGVMRWWPWAAALVVVGLGLQRWAVAVELGFKEPMLSAALTATGALVALPIAGIVARLLGGARRPATGLGLFAPRERAAVDAGDGPVALWTWLLVGAVTLVGLTLAARTSSRHLVDIDLAAAVFAGAAIVTLAMALIAAHIVGHGLRAIAVRLGRWSPFTRWLPTLVLLYAVVAAAIVAGWIASPAIRAVLTENGRIRRVLAIGVFIAGAAASLGWPRARPVAARRRRHGLLAAATAMILVPCTLLWWGADAETKFIPVSSSPPLDTLISWVRSANDLDGDGYGSWLGENDCAPFDGAIHPLARDLPDDGIDQNCDGRDFSMTALARPAGGGAPVPDAFKQPWNVLLITVDTVRFDHTTMGGYASGPKHRDTTPRLNELAERSTLFTWAQAPSAGTMASMPAIMTSKFFHSGIALGPERRGQAPMVLPENLLIGEVMKQRGYETGAITTHPYFNDWGMDQGIDSYDNSIGKTDDPRRIAAHAVTDSALAWIAKQRGNKWFLWTHYIDPHGRYMAHPDGPAYGTTEEDLYDQELHYTDQHIGRLLDELARMPGAEHTIVVLTSDHGDGFNEHGFINHGQALYRELLNVPLIVYVPNNLPRRITGAVSGLDVFPTIAELAGEPVAPDSVEGMSLVPQIFYGLEQPDRIVFAETNWPQPLRAAISASYKLIYNLKSNVYELYDLQRDPWEHSNLANKAPAVKATYKTALDAWLERVLFTRDADRNQATMKAAELMLEARPTPVAATTGITLDGGHLAVLGASLTPGTKTPKPGGDAKVDIYFEVLRPLSTGLRFGIEVLPTTAATFVPTAPWTSKIARVGARITLDGLFPSERWQPGEFIREQFTVKLTKDAAGDALGIALLVAGGDGKKLAIAGPGAAVGDGRVVLGLLPWAGPPTPAPAPLAPGSGMPPSPRP